MRARTKRKIKIRKSIRYFYLVSAILILTCSCSYLIKTLILAEKNNIKTKEIYSYNNKFDYLYKVNLIDNPYIDEKALQMKDNVYVTDLIKSIDLDLNYKYDASKQSEIQYEYVIKGYIEAMYTKDGEEQKVWEKEYILLDTQTETENSDNIKIEKKLSLNLKEQNNLVKKFEQEMGMNVEAKYIVKMEVKISTNIEGQDIKTTYVSTINTDLAEKTTKISGQNNKEDKKYISKQVTEQVQYNVIPIIISIILDIIAIGILRYVFKKTKPMNRIRNEYRQELNRILRICQDKIVQVSTQIDINNERIIDVKDFGEVIKVSEELFKPILYWCAKDKEEAWFCVVSNHMTYRYILKGGESIK